MSPCEDCHAGCCRSFAVPVSGADIMRIEYGLGLSFWDFVCRWEDPDGRIALNYAPHFFFDDEPETQFVISLMHHESEYFKETTRCRFLTEGAPDEEHSLGQARCGIYNFRPGACRVFPTKFDPASELAVIHDVPERSRDGDSKVYDLFPRPCLRIWIPFNRYTIWSSLGMRCNFSEASRSFGIVIPRLGVCSRISFAWSTHAESFVKRI
jgi:Fe-S-cluster containining protein